MGSGRTSQSSVLSLCVCVFEWVFVASEIEIDPSVGPSDAIACFHLYSGVCRLWLLYGLYIMHMHLRGAGKCPNDMERGRRCSYYCDLKENKERKTGDTKTQTPLPFPFTSACHCPPRPPSPPPPPPPSAGCGAGTPTASWRSPRSPAAPSAPPAPCPPAPPGSPPYP